jgi:hypothetical protein
MLREAAAYNANTQEMNDMQETATAAATGVSFG